MPALADITPVILTYNETSNIARCLAHLRWAKQVVVVDSESEDDTQRVAAAFSNVKLFTRSFDNHSTQWRFAVEETGISTDWILALDADYVVPLAVTEWIAQLDAAEVVGVSFPFRYAVFGRVLRSGIYPPVTVLYRRMRATYVQDGHTQRVEIEGRVARAPIALIHDDRKPLAQWFRSQGRYAQLEAEKLEVRSSGLKAWLRTSLPISPLLIGLHCLVLRGGLFEGPSGWLYALQRMVAEGLIVIAYQDRRLRRRSTDANLGP
ncbi:glycosyltransferase family 2 protein [Terricaulis silvestris]|uniref:Transferase 2, rSAM/selenodomain-associated n=1 Tax=Terricaulis silvestris TaxID=2686094 RepID=A0A6I6MJY0_9CAUL|nr:glycosyltransferase family 2 protein [Terricaulis silvestris]QGZ93396.1 transferase 2, rSAM/selenodomain-associated [Terricaulis silvestris]